MEQITIKKEEVPSIPTIQVALQFEQLFELVQQLSDEKRIEFLDKLQAELEAAKLIQPRMDEKQRQNHVPLQQPDRPGRKKLLVTQEELLKWEEEAFEDDEDLDKDLTDKEFVEMLKNI